MLCGQATVRLGQLLESGHVVCHGRVGVADIQAGVLAGEQLVFVLGHVAWDLAGAELCVEALVGRVAVVEIVVVVVEGFLGLGGRGLGHFLLDSQSTVAVGKAGFDFAALRALLVFVNGADIDP